jgi:hypothetical protein
VSASAAGGILMWVAGVSVAIGVTGPNYSLIFLGVFLSIAGVLYIRRFAEKHS